MRKDLKRMENRVEEEEWKIVEMTTRIKVINFTYGSYFSFLARFGYIYVCGHYLS